MSERADSIRRLHYLCIEDRGQITKWLPRVKQMSNGIEYYFVQVTCENNLQYGIQAFGAEATSLYIETMNMLQTQKVVSLVHNLYK